MAYTSERIQDELKTLAHGAAATGFTIATLAIMAKVKGMTFKGFEGSVADILNPITNKPMAVKLPWTVGQALAAHMPKAIMVEDATEPTDFEALDFDDAFAVSLQYLQDHKAWAKGIGAATWQVWAKVAHLEPQSDEAGREIVANFNAEADAKAKAKEAKAEEAKPKPQAEAPERSTEAPKREEAHASWEALLASTLTFIGQADMDTLVGLGALIAARQDALRTEARDVTPEPMRIAS